VSGRGEWMEVTIISHGVELSITRGVAGAEDAPMAYSIIN